MGCFFSKKKSPRDSLEISVPSNHYLSYNCPNQWTYSAGLTNPQATYDPNPYDPNVDQDKPIYNLPGLYDDRQFTHSINPDGSYHVPTVPNETVYHRNYIPTESNQPIEESN